MALTHDQLEAVGRAQRLLADSAFIDTVTALEAIAHEDAVAAQDRAVREEARHRVLALRSIVEALRTVAEAQIADAAQQRTARTFE